MVVLRYSAKPQWIVCVTVESLKMWWLVIEAMTSARLAIDSMIDSLRMARLTIKPTIDSVRVVQITIKGLLSVRLAIVTTGFMEELMGLVIAILSKWRSIKP